MNMFDRGRQLLAQGRPIRDNHTLSHSPENRRRIRRARAEKLAKAIQQDKTGIAVEAVPVADFKQVANAEAGSFREKTRKELESFARTITRSDRLAVEMQAQGADERLAVQKLLVMLDAKVKRWVPVSGKPGEGEWEMVPDYRWIGWALEFMAKTHGWFFALPSQPLQVSQTTLTIAKDVEGMTAEQVLHELPGAVLLLQQVVSRRPSIENAEAEVVDDPR